MERELVLSSYEVKNIGSNKPENFVTKNDNALILDKSKKICCRFEQNYKYEFYLV